MASDFVGESFVEERAAELILELLKPAKLSVHHLLQRAYKVLTAYPKRSYSFAERRARVSRVLGITKMHADIFLLNVDRFIDPHCFSSEGDLKQTFPDLEVIQWYRDGVGSDVARSLDVGLPCPFDNCTICGHYFEPFSSTDSEMNESKISKSDRQQTHLFTSHGIYTAFEVPRTCANSSCRSIHYTSHVETRTCLDQLQHHPYSIDDIQVLRSTQVTFVSASVLNSAVFLYDEGRVPFDTIVDLLCYNRRDLGARAPRFISPKLMQRSAQQWLILWWREKGVRVDLMPKLDVTEIFGSRECLEHFLARETRDISRADRGWFAKALTVSAIHHSGPSCDHECPLGLVQDGQFDLIRVLDLKRNKNIAEERIEDRGSIHSEAAGAAAGAAADVAAAEVGLNEVTVVRGNGDIIYDEESGEHKQIWDPLIRTVVQCTVSFLVGVIAKDNVGNPVQIIEQEVRLMFDCGEGEGCIRGIVTHKDTSHVWSVYLFNCTTPTDGRTGTFLQMSTTEVSAISCNKLLDLEDIPDYLWSTVEHIPQGKLTGPSSILHRAPLQENTNASFRDEESDDDEMMSNTDYSSSEDDAEKITEGTISEARVPKVSSSVVEKNISKVVFASYNNTVDCISKENSQPVRRFRRPRTNHIEVIASTCRVNFCIREFETTGEGAITNVQQFIDLMDDFIEQGRPFPLVRFVDDECSNVLHLFTEMTNIARDKPIRHSSIYGVIAMLCLDGCIDAFHFLKQHKETFCRKFLNPYSRNFSDAFNSEAVEQNWQELVKHVPSLTYMTAGNFRFLLLSLVMMENIARCRISPEVLAKHNRKRNRRDLDNMGKSKHKRNYALAHGARLNVKKQPQRGQVHGRLPIPDDFFSSMPDGYDPRLRKESENKRRLYTHVDASIFKVHEAELVGIIRLHIPKSGFGRPPVASLFRARMALHRWLVDKVVEAKNC